MAFSTGVTLLQAGFIPSVFTFTSSGTGQASSTTGAVNTDIPTTVSITNSSSDGGFGTLTNTSWVVGSVLGNGVGTYSQSLLSPVSSLTNTLRCTLSAASFAWREASITLTATTSTGATRNINRTVRSACNYNGASTTYSTSTLSGDNNTKSITYTDPFNGQAEPSNILTNGVTLSTYNSSSSDFRVSYSGGVATVTLKPDRLGTFGATLNHSVIDSWGIAGTAGGNYSASATRNLQWYAAASSSVNSNSIGMSFNPNGDLFYRRDGTSPTLGTVVSSSSWIGNSRQFDILDPSGGFFPIGSPYYQIKVAHVSGNTGWTFNRSSSTSFTPLNKDQWYDMTFNSSLPAFLVHLTSNGVNGVYSCVVNVEIRNLANTVSYSQNVTLTVTDD